jgi:ATP-dependent Lhr-like helicase
MRNVLDAFHPLIGGWFRERFGAPTEPQLAGWPRIHAGEDVLIAAPTGSGKTLAAFLACLDDLVRRGLERPSSLSEGGTQIVYVSPLKALSNDVHRNLESPLAELAAFAAARGERSSIFGEIRVATRTGDTPPSERARLAKHPPHILVTTPESLFILLTSQSGRASLANLRTVIVDEIHAVAGDKRGAHLALSLERLDRLVEQSAGRKPVRVGLSATQRPIERIARLLVGTRRPLPFIADAGHRRALDLAIEITDDELGAVASNEQFGRVYDRIAELVTQHRSTIVFVNTRRLVERAAAALEQRLGEEHVVAHHGSMSRALRLAAEQKLKYGQVKCAVATASLELGIDVGAVDLVVQLGSPRSIATLLQRVGRSNHTVDLRVMPKGRMFALTRDQLVECAALVRGIRRGNLDEIGLRDAPLDILAQQIVAAAAAEDELPEAELAEMIRGAAPYAALDDVRLEQVLAMVSEGVSDRRGRNGAHVHRDRVGGKLRGRRGARLAAITSGGAIPDMNTYDVVQWPEEIRVGTLDEDFAIESSAGDIFQLGNTAWKIRRVEAGRVLVEDAHGQPPTIPFWVGEGPARTAELSDEVSDLRREIDTRLNTDDIEQVAAWLAAECGMHLRAAQQLVAYLVAGRTALGALPRNDLLVAERFFDEAGGMQLVIHAPLGGRINRAWGLALRKKFCRTFDFELQAAATDDGIVISLGQPHSFALETVFGFVPAHQAQDTLIQALLDRPMFEIRWRWNVTRSLVVLRRKNGKKVPPHLIKMRSADTLSVVFPQAQACPENLPGSLPGMPGDREIPDHPLVFETIRDCLVEAMDLTGFQTLIDRLERGEIQIAARDTVEPSPLSHELLNANPYAYLDDAPLEERRTRAVQVRRGLPAAAFGAANDDQIGALDEDAIAAAAAEVAPTVRDVDELHDALLGLWLVPEDLGMRLAPEAADWMNALAASGRACRLTWTCEGIACAAWVATDKLGAARTILGEQVECTPAIATPAWAKRFDDHETAITKLVGAHLDHRGPVSTRALAAELGLKIADVVDAVLALEADGGILRGRFTRGTSGAATTARQAIDAATDTAALHDLEWCNRRVLARIHRMTLAKLRKEIEPVSAAALQRFLLRWQRVAKNRQLIGADGLARVIEQLQGFETASGAWEREILPARLCTYDASWLDQMCLAGHLVWCRLSPRKPNAVEESDEPAANDERSDVPSSSSRKPRRERRLDKRLVAPLRDLFGDRYDLAEAGAEAARRAGASRDEIAAAAAKALGDSVPVRAAEVITSLVTATAMLKNELDEQESSEVAGVACDLEAPSGHEPPEVADVACDLEAPSDEPPDLTATGTAVRTADARHPTGDSDVRITDERPPETGDSGGSAPNVRTNVRTSDREAPEAAATTDSDVRITDERTPETGNSGGSARDVRTNVRTSDREHGRLRAVRPTGVASAGTPSRRVRVADEHARPRGAEIRDARGGEASERSALVRRSESVAMTRRTDGLPASNSQARAPSRGPARCAPSRSAPLALMLRRDVAWLRAAAAIDSSETAPIGEAAQRIRDHLARVGASFLPDLVASIDLLPDEIEDALWELVGAGLATADGFASLRVLVDRKRGEVKSLFDVAKGSGPIARAEIAKPVRSWQDAIRKVRTHDRTRPGHALRSLPTAAGRWSLLPPVSAEAIDAEASARQLLLRYGVVFRDLVTREACLPPWRDLLVALRRLEARGEIRGGRFVTGFVGEQFALPEALDELRAVRHAAAMPEVSRVAATDPLNLVGILSPGPRVPAVVGNAVLYVDGQAVASLEAGELVRRAPIPEGARIDDDLTYHPPPRRDVNDTPPQAALPL